MPDPSSLMLFVLAALALLLTPGPAVLYVVTRSLEKGRLGGLASTLGLAVGSLFHIAAAALGLSTLLMSSAVAYDVVRYLGAGYLVVLGVRKLSSRESTRPAALAEASSLYRVFGHGVAVNVLNPKAALFYFAFLPQFVDVSRGSVTTQILFLGFVFTLLGVLTDTLWALLADLVGSQLRRHRDFLRFERYVTGGVLVALGIAAAVSRRQ